MSIAIQQACRSCGRKPLRLLPACLALLLMSGAAFAQSDLPELPLPQESVATETAAPSAHLFLRELAKRQQEWTDSKGRFTLLANLFPAVLEQEGVVYNMEANGEWLLQNGLLVFQVLDDYRREYDVLAWEQDRVWSVNSSGEIGSRSKIEMDEIARELLGMVDDSQELIYQQTRSYLNLAELTQYNALPAESFRPVYTSLGYQVARPAQGVLLLHRAGKENNASRNLWFGAVAFGGSCAWLKESGNRMRIMPYMDSGTDGVDSLLRNALQSLVAGQNRYRGAYQHFADLKELSGLYFERLDFSGQLPQSASGIVYSFKLSEDRQKFSVVAEMSGRRLFTDQNGEIKAYNPFEAGENYLPLPGITAKTGFLADEGPVQPAEGLETSLLKARIELLGAVLNHVHLAEEAHLLRHGSYASLPQLVEDGLLKLDESTEDGSHIKDGVQLSLELSTEADQYILQGSVGDVLRLIDEGGTIRDPQS